MTAQAAYMRTYRAKNREKCRAYQKAYMQDWRELQLAAKAAVANRIKK